MSSYKNAPMNLEQAISIINELEQKVEDLQNSLKVVAEENDKISFKLTVAKESNVQSAEKIKLLDLQRKDAEYKLKDVLGAYRIMKEALKKINER